MHERFIDSLERIVKCDVATVTNANVDKLSEADCRRALPLACKMLCQLTNIAGIKIVLGQAFEKLKECQGKQLVRWEAEAKKHAQEVARLRAEAEATEKRLKQLTSDVNACVKRLCTLWTPSTKARKGTFS